MGKAVIWSDFWSGLNMPENPFVDIRLNIQLLILAAFFSRICLPLSKWEQNLLSFQGFWAGQYFVSFCKYFQILVLNFTEIEYQNFGIQYQLQYRLDHVILMIFR